MQTILFIYNTDSGVSNRGFDFLHKFVSPSTYPCSLCAISHSFIGMKAEWKVFYDQILLKKIFLHRDEFELKYKEKTRYTFPTILLDTDGLLEVIVSTEQIKEGSLDSIKADLTNFIS